MKRRLIITAVVGGLFFGGAGVALADPQGLGPRPDGETGPRCAAALEHAGQQGVADGNDARNTALTNAASHCKG